MLQVWPCAGVLTGTPLAMIAEYKGAGTVVCRIAPLTALASADLQALRAA
jgi:hypothetical protein